MRRVVIGLLLVLLQFVAVPAFADGTVVWTVSSVGSLTAYTATVTATAGGAATGNATITVPGQILQVKIVPGTAGDQPDDNFDVELRDADGLDILGGQGANCDNATPTLVAGVAVWTDRQSPTLDVVLAGAGSANVITVTVLIQQ